MLLSQQKKGVAKNKKRPKGINWKLRGGNQISQKSSSPSQVFIKPTIKMWISWQLLLRPQHIPCHAYRPTCKRADLKHHLTLFYISHCSFYFNIARWLFSLTLTHPLTELKLYSSWKCWWLNWFHFFSIAALRGFNSFHCTEILLLEFNV